MARLNSLIYSTLGQFTARDYTVVILQSDQTRSRHANLETLLAFLADDNPTVLLLINGGVTVDPILRFDCLVPTLKQRQHPVFILGPESLGANLVYSIRYRILKLNRPTELKNVRSIRNKNTSSKGLPGDVADGKDGSDSNTYDYPFVESIGEDSSSNPSPPIIDSPIHQAGNVDISPHQAGSPRCYIKLEYDRQRDKTAIHRDIKSKVTVLTFEINRHHPFRVMNLVNIFLRESDYTLKEFCDKCIVDEQERPRLQASFAIDLDDSWGACCPP